jgi:hypothetical protein
LVCALDKDGNVLDYYVTDKYGNFALEELVPGDLRIVVSKVGYEDAEIFVTADYESNYQFYNEILLSKEVSLVESNNNLGISILQSENNLTINSAPETVIDNVRIYDLYGNLVSESKSPGKPVQIRLDALSNGVYFVRVATNKGIDNFKISIVR